MKKLVCLIIFSLIPSGLPAFAIAPEAARKELAQENIPYTAATMINHIESGNTKVVTWFLAIGMDVDARNEFGESGLMLAAEQGRFEMVKLLLSKNADVNAVDLSHRTALMNAAQNGHTAIVKLLLDKGADVNAASQWKSTALHEASMNGHAETVQTLLNAGADLKRVNNAGHTALIEAIIEGQEPIVQRCRRKRRRCKRIIGGRNTSDCGGLERQKGYRSHAHRSGSQGERPCQKWTNRADLRCQCTG
jgi:ankyrin repeat protein